MKLYSYWRSSAAYRIRIALNLKELEYETIHVDLLSGEHLGDAYALQLMMLRWMIGITIGYDSVLTRLKPAW